MTSARTALVVRTLVVGAVVLGTAGFVTADKVVTVAIDGEEQAVRTFSATVDAVLAEEEVTLGEHDTLIPAAGSAIADGGRIEIRRGRLVVLNVDGVAHEVWTTAATVDELAASLGSRFAAASLTASRSQRIPLSGLSVDLRMPKSVTVVHDGTSTEVVTTEPTVGAVLLEAGVDVAAADLLSTELDAGPGGRPDRHGGPGDEPPGDVAGEDSLPHHQEGRPVPLHRRHQGREAGQPGDPPHHLRPDPSRRHRLHQGEGLLADRPASR